MQTQMAAGSGSMMDRLMGVITLKAPTYREIADDKTATMSAALIVVVATLVSGFFTALVQTDPTTGTITANPVIGVIGAIVGVVAGLIGWAVGAWILAFVAKSFFQGKTDTGEMLRVTGYVHIFNIVGVLSVLSLASVALACVVGLISFVVAILRLIGYVIGVREAAEFSTTNAVITAIIAAIVEFLIVAVITGVVLGAVILAMGVGRAAGG